MSLRQLIANAYRINWSEVDGPGWLPSIRFDIVAKLPQAARKADAPLMLKALLAERFQLAVHEETREESALALVVRKDGPKLKESEPEPDTPDEPARKSKGPIGALAVGEAGVRYTLDYANAAVHFEGARMTMADLVDVLTKADAGNGRPIVDLTGLKGSYDIVLDVPFSAIGIAPAAGTSPVAPHPGSGRMPKSLKDLGLALVTRKAPVRHVIVDHIERTPTEN